ncbi:hypothetical protein Fmac_006407 [Flemingia macrophylla]|uniref:Uncharacterized protein n=1 Tax=Flemingia macrophylla TaxID=520843 RepID=A0ABD1NBQ4_9FABA
MADDHPGSSDLGPVSGRFHQRLLENLMAPHNVPRSHACPRDTASVFGGSGCCKPPTQCAYMFVNPTYWISPINTAADMDCLQWSNDQTQFCYNYDSCKAGLLANLRKEWRRANVILIITVIGLIIVYLIGCCAFRNSKTEDLFRKYEQGYT